MPPEPNDDREKAKLPEGFQLDQDRWAPKAAPAAAAAPATPAAAAPAPKKDFMQKLGEAAERGGYGAGVFAQREHPEAELARAGYEHLRGGEIQKGLHELIGAGLEFARPTAGLMGAGGVMPMVKGLVTAYGGQKLGEKAGPAVGLTPELGGDIGGIVGGALPTARPLARAARGTPRYSRAGIDVMSPHEPAPETLPQARAPEAPAAPPVPRGTPPRAPAPTATETLDAATQQFFPGKKFGELDHADQMTVMRGGAGGGPAMPGPEAPQERRIADVGRPGGAAERRVAPGVYQRSGYSQPTAGEQLAEQIRIARAGQPSGITEGAAQAEIMRDPAEWERFVAGDRKTKDTMLIAAKNRMVQAQAPAAGTLPPAPAPMTLPSARPAAPGLSGATLPTTPTGKGPVGTPPGGVPKLEDLIRGWGGVSEPGTMPPVRPTEEPPPKK